MEIKNWLLLSTVNSKGRAYSSQMNQKIRMCHSTNDRIEEFERSEVQHLLFHLKRVNGVTTKQK